MNSGMCHCPHFYFREKRAWHYEPWHACVTIASTLRRMSALWRATSTMIPIQNRYLPRSVLDRPKQSSSFMHHPPPSKCTIHCGTSNRKSASIPSLSRYAAQKMHGWRESIAAYFFWIALAYVVATGTPVKAHCTCKIQKCDEEMIYFVLATCGDDYTNQPSRCG